LKLRVESTQDEIKNENQRRDASSAEEKEGGAGEFFQGLGFRAGVPGWLRYHDTVPYDGYARKQTVGLIRSILGSKRRHEKNRKKKELLPKYVSVYTRDKTENGKEAARLAYNLVDSLYAHKGDAEVDMFRHLLLGEWQEEVEREGGRGHQTRTRTRTLAGHLTLDSPPSYKSPLTPTLTLQVYHDQMRMSDQLDAMICKLDREDTGKVPKHSIRDCLLPYMDI